MPSSSYEYLLFICVYCFYVPPQLEVTSVMSHIPKSKVVIVLDLIKGHVRANLWILQTKALQHGLIFHDDHMMLQKNINRIQKVLMKRVPGIDIRNHLRPHYDKSWA